MFTFPIPGLDVPSLFNYLFTHPASICWALLWAHVEWEGRVLDPTGRPGPDSALAGGQTQARTMARMEA